MDLVLTIQRNDIVSVLPLEKKTHASLANKFERLSTAFLNADTPVHDYAPAFTPEPGELLKLKYNLPANIWAFRSALPNGTAELDGHILEEVGLRANIAVDCGSKPRFLFQAIDNRYLVQPRSIALFFNKTFQFNDAVGISFPERVDAIHENGHLYFRSELVVRRFLDIEAHFTKATDEELEEYFAGDGFAPLDIDAVKAIANDPLRRKLHGIISSGRRIDPKAVAAVAKRVGLVFKLKDGKLVVPTIPGDFREFVRLLDDSYLESMLDHRNVYFAASKRKLP
jgi:hypothetical protein